MTTHIIVESLRDWEAVKETIEGEVHWHSTSPMVIEDLTSQGIPVHWLNRSLDTDLPDQIGHACLAAVDELREHLRKTGADIGWNDLDVAIAFPLLHLLSALAYKAAVLQAWEAATDGELRAVGHRDMTPGSNGNIGVDRFDTLFAILATRLPKTSVQVIEVAEGARKDLLLDVERLTAYDRLLSLADLSFGQLAYRFLRFVRKGKQTSLKSGGPRVMIMRDNETVREIIPALWAKGASVEMVSPRAPKSGPGEVLDHVPPQDIIRKILEKAGQNHGVDLPWDVIADLVAERLQQASRHWKAISETADKTATGWINGSDRPAAILSNAISGLSAQATASHDRAMGLPVVVSEHGVSAGLSYLHEPTRPFGEPAHGDRYLVCSDKASQFYEAEETVAAGSVTPIGLAAQTRGVPLRPIQRYLARKRFGAKFGQRVVLYLGRSVQNNMRFLPYSQEDDELYLTEKAIGHEILPKVRGLGVMKLYPTRRYLDPTPLGHRFESPTPVKTVQWGDFRFLRAGADIIILESPMSTLGWVMGTGKPICYLSQPKFPLLPDAKAAMEKAFFFFDLSDDRWKEKLVETLNLPDADIAQRWNAMKSARQAFLADYVFGPENPGRNGAQAVIDIANKAAATQAAGN